MFHFILKNFIEIIHKIIYTETLHVSDTSKYRAVDYIHLKCVKQYNKIEHWRKNAGFNFLILTRIHQLLWSWSCFLQPIFWFISYDLRGEMLVSHDSKNSVTASSRSWGDATEIIGSQRNHSKALGTGA